jgi:hypothetical protein
MRTLWIAVVWGILALGSAAVPGKPAGISRLDPQGFRLRSETLTSEECREIYLTLIENFVGWSETRFTDDDTYEAGGGRFRAAGSGVDWARGNSNLCIAYAVLLTAHPERKTFTVRAVPRAQLADHLRRTIRFLCLSYKGKKRPRWGPGWQVSLDFIGGAWAAHLFEKNLDKETVRRVRAVTCAVADSLKKRIPSRRFGDTGSEDCTWNAPFLAFAANKYADDPRSKTWDALCNKWALNALSTAGDKTSEKVVDGRPLNEWIVSENVHPDLTIENHHMWSVGYQVACQAFAHGELAYTVFGRKPPEAFAHHAGDMWRGVTRALYLWDGDILFPTGQDWSWKSYAQSEYLCWQRLSCKQAAAGALESRAIQMALKRQLAVGTGALGYSNFGNNTTKPNKWAFSYLCHKHMDDPDPVSMKEAYKQSLGVYLFPHVRVAIHRAPLKCVSVAWHEKHQPIYILPEGDSTFTDPPFFFPYDREAGGVHLSRVSSAKERGRPLPWSRIKLLEAKSTHDGNGMRVCYTRSREDGMTQHVGVVSLPDESTLCCMAFRAGKAGTYRIRKPFHFQAATIQGFPMRLESHRGTRWLNLSDHVGFVSTEPLPETLGPGRFCAAAERTVGAKAGDWFGRLAVVVYARQPHRLTEKRARSVRLVGDTAEGQMAVEWESSSGLSTVRFELPGRQEE